MKTRATKFFVWDPATLSVKVAAMDAQHEILIDKMNALHAANARHAPRPELTTLLADLTAYTRRHFSEEETYLTKVGYAGLEQHKGIHKQLLDRMGQHVADFEKAGTLGDAFFAFLSFWLSAHIRGIDSKYAPTSATAARV